MVSIVVSFSMILLFLVSGRLFEAFKYFIKLIFDSLFKLLNLFGIHIDMQEQRIRTSKEFKNTFKDIRIVKKSNKNEKIKPSINRFAAVILIIGLASIIINLQVVSGNCISVWLYETGWFTKFIDSQRNMDVTFTAVVFSAVSFAISKLITQWKETKKYRLAKKEIALKKEAAQKLSSKQLLDMAKELDEENLKKSLKN